jgi:hypothetical protein
VEIKEQGYTLRDQLARTRGLLDEAKRDMAAALDAEERALDWYWRQQAQREDEQAEEAVVDRHEELMDAPQRSASS